jgi:phenylacetate-CoA ligase
MNSIEYLSRDAWRQWHTELLQSSVNRAYGRVSFYRKIMDEQGVTPEMIRELDDITLLPFTTRNDLAANYPYGLFAVPLRDIVRIHTLRSSQRHPVVTGCTRQDIEHRKQLAIRFLDVCGVTQDDIVQICLDPGMSVLGDAIREAAEAMEALVIPTDPLSASERLDVMSDFRTTVLVTTPTYAMHLLFLVGQKAVPPVSLNLKKGIMLGETLDEEIRMKLEDGFGMEVRAAYGIMEATGPGMAYECEHKNGLHLAMDHVIPEIIDPDTGRAVPEGREGELVITTVWNRSNPLIRFRTGDMTSLETSLCPCGRTTWRIAPISGRCDNLVTVRGVKISPEKVKAVIKGASSGRELPFVVMLDERNRLVDIELHVAMDSEAFSGSLPQLHDWVRAVENCFEETIGVSCRVKPVELRSIQKWLDEGKLFVWS